MEEITYRKANKNDINSIANLVTKLIGTCNLKETKSIDENNIEEISNTIDKYYVCEINNTVIGACGLSEVKSNDEYNLN